MSMVDYFLSQHPQQVREGIHCLLAALSLHPPPRIEARARLQLGLVLYHHTNNLLEAREHLDKAVSMSVCDSKLGEKGEVKGKRGGERVSRCEQV